MENTSAGAAPVETAAMPEAPSQETTETNEENTTLEGASSQKEAPKAKEMSKKEEKELKKTLKTLKLKVDKEEFEENLPFDLPDDPQAVEYMKKQLQMAKMGGKRAQAYSELENEVREFVDLLRKNPKKALSDPSIGLDLKKLAAEIIEEEIENSKKSPDQLERERLAAELEEIRREREQERDQYKKKEIERIQAQAYTDYETNINKALDKNNLPKTPYTIKKMASYMYDAMKEGIQVSPDDVVPLVRDEMHNDLKEMFAVMPEDVIEQMVGKDVLNRIRKKNLAKAKEKPPVPVNKSVVDVGAGKSNENKEPAKKMTIKQWLGV